MVEKDVMVIVPIGKYEGIKMWRSEAIRQGLTYRLIGKEYAGKIEDKMGKPVENKALPKRPPVFEPEPAVPVTPPGVIPLPPVKPPVSPDSEGASKTSKRKPKK